MPGAGALTADQLQAVAKQSCAVLTELGPSIQWLHSYVTDDRVYCTYLAPSADLVREHALRAGFPADVVVQVRATIDPTTAE
jgi:cell division inhibitor SulA